MQRDTNSDGTLDATYFFIADGLGSIVKIVDATGNVVNNYIYDSFGNIVQKTEGVPNFYTFTGREFDAESGLYYFRARYYDPKIGRFISPDPSGFSDGTNLYIYTHNNPVTYKDPSGEIAVVDDAVIATAIAALTATGAVITGASIGQWIWDNVLQPLHKEQKEKGRNWATEQAKNQAQANPGKDPCDILSEMLEQAKCSGTSKRIKDIEQAQKFLGCRNIRKRGN